MQLSASLRASISDEQAARAGRAPSIVPQIKALLAASQESLPDGTTASEGSASTRSGSSSETSSSVCSSTSASSEASQHGFHRGPTARPQRSKSAGAIRPPSYLPPRAAHIAALEAMAAARAAQKERRTPGGSSVTGSEPSATPTKSTSSSGSKRRASSASASSSGYSSSRSSAQQTRRGARCPRGAAYMPYPFRGVAGIAVR
jgi:hypothetical protein